MFEVFARTAKVLIITALTLHSRHESLVRSFFFPQITGVTTLYCCCHKHSNDLENHVFMLMTIPSNCYLGIERMILSYKDLLLFIFFSILALMYSYRLGYLKVLNVYTVTFIRFIIVQLLKINQVFSSVLQLLQI